MAEMSSLCRPDPRRGTGARKFAPQGLRRELVARLGGAFQQAGRQQIGALGEGDEQHAVEHFLRGLDGLKSAERGPSSPLTR